MDFLGGGWWWWHVCVFNAPKTKKFQAPKLKCKPLHFAVNVWVGSVLTIPPQLQHPDVLLVIFIPTITIAHFQPISKYYRFIFPTKTQTRAVTTTPALSLVDLPTCSPQTVNLEKINKGADLPPSALPHLHGSLEVSALVTPQQPSIQPCHFLFPLSSFFFLMAFSSIWHVMYLSVPCLSPSITRFYYRLFSTTIWAPWGSLFRLVYPVLKRIRVIDK